MDLILIDSSEISPLNWTITHAEFRKDISSNTKVFYTKLDFERSIRMSAICFSDPNGTIFSKIELFFWTIPHANFREDFSLNEKVVYISDN